MQAFLEHANITVENPDQTASLMCDLFDWRVRWSGASMDDGYTVHVGSNTSYIALYTNSKVPREPLSNKPAARPLNHIAVVVEDLNTVKEKAISLGLEPFGFANYKPGKRFYVRDEQDLEIEIVAYKKPLLYWALSLHK